MDMQLLFDELKTLGVNIGQSTIRKYVLENLIPAPTVRSLGRGLGKQSEYPEEALGQAYAAWKLLNGSIQTKISILKQIRPFAIQLFENCQVIIDKSILINSQLTYKDLMYLIELWINYNADVGTRYEVFRVDIDFDYKPDTHLKFALEQTKMARLKPREFFCNT